MYAAIDPEYPTFLRQSFTAELKRNFIYQMTTWIVAVAFSAFLAGLAAIMAYTEHPKMAVTFISTNILGIAVKLLGKSKRGS